MPPEPSAAEIYGRDFPAGAVVFEEGDPGSRMYVIQSGEVRIVKRVGQREITLARLGPGEAFGEMALLEGQPRSATAIVETTARILEIDEVAFGDLVRRNGEIALRLLRRLSARLREANRQIRNFLSADAMGRAVEVLKALSGAADDDGFRLIPPDIGPEGLAVRVGAPAGAAALWPRLRRARLVREVGGHSQLAPVEVVDSFLRYVDLRARYHALAAGELSEAPDLEVEGPDGIAAELLHARLAADGEVADARTSAEYEDYLALRRRFEPDDPVPTSDGSRASAGEGNRERKPT
jgi:CRP/FNR family transcriptional regulator, cyclic AMP receptor protein